jgi:hypothetical protein
MSEKIETTKSVLRQRMTPRKKVFQRVASTDDGSLVFGELYKFCGINRPSHVKGDSHETAHNEGMKVVARHIQGILKQSDQDVEDAITQYTDSMQYDPFNK